MGITRDDRESREFKVGECQGWIPGPVTEKLPLVSALNWERSREAMEFKSLPEVKQALVGTHSTSCKYNILEPLQSTLSNILFFKLGGGYLSMN